MEDIVVDVSSSKINAALKEMLRIRRDQPGDKIIVVSQFTSFLSILQPLLRDNLFPMVRLDDSMSHMVRSEVVSDFQSSPGFSNNCLHRFYCSLFGCFFYTFFQRRNSFQEKKRKHDKSQLEIAPFV